MKMHLANVRYIGQKTFPLPGEGEVAQKNQFPKDSLLWKELQFVQLNFSFFEDMKKIVKIHHVGDEYKAGLKFSSISVTASADFYSLILQEYKFEKIKCIPKL